MDKKIVMIDPFSGMLLFLEVGIGASQSITSSGTGFVVSHNAVNYLITNWHIVTARNAETGQPLSETGAADPKTIGIWFHSVTQVGAWVFKTECLIDRRTGYRRWLEHPKGREIDVVALPLSDHNAIKNNPLDRNLASTDLIITPSEPVSIIGFPYGLSSGGRFPIWKTGHIASDVGIDYNSKPVFLIDATTKQGMSGSPVIAKRSGFFEIYADGQFVGGKERIKFLGVYSGRIHEQSDIGMVWKPEVIDAIFSNPSTPQSDSSSSSTS